MHSTRYSFLILFIAAIAILSSCKKYLDKKPSDDLITPESISDAQGMVDNIQNVNYFNYAAEILCDDYYLSYPDWLTLANQSQLHYNLHTWERYDSTNTFWNSLYQGVSIANIVLDALPDLEYDPTHPDDYNNVKGSALFLRGFYFYHLAQMFTKPYDKSTAATDLGIVLRQNPDINEKSVRSTVQATYDQILQDLKSSIPLLPAKPLLEGKLVKTRPSLPAVYGALARTYLSMNEYDSAGKYAGLCLQLDDSLMNYNSLNPASNVPFSKYNPEVIFAARSVVISNSYIGTRSKIDSNLYKSYSDSDLRKQLFFKASPTGGFLFKGDYDGIGLPTAQVNTFFSFTGIVTDEMYLIQAECYARKNDVASALNTLNKLLQTRYKTGQFTPVSVTTAQEALTCILKERRKELLRRGTRWADIKRLTKDEQFRILPQRVINGQPYPMPVPYVMLIPAKVIAESGVPQN